MSIDAERSAKYSNAPDLEDTDERQAALRRYHILDTAPEKDFDRITSLVAKICSVPTALITLIDKERQWFKSCFGFDARETGIGVSFCVHAVHDGEMLVVEDATKDPRFKDNPIVTGPPNLRFYAGAPLTTPEGIHIGSLCIIDYRTRVFDASQREILERLADVVVSQFELRSAEAQVRQLVDENPQPMYVYAESDGHIMRSNPAVHRQYGYSADAFDSLHAADLQAPDSKQHMSGSLDIHQRADGSTFPVHLRQKKVLMDGKAAILAVPHTMPMHDEATSVFWMDREGTIRSLSTSEADASPLPNAAVGDPLVDLVDPLDQSLVDSMLQSVFSGDQDASAQEVNMHIGGQPEAFELHVQAMGNGDGQQMGATGALIPSAAAPSAELDVTQDRKSTTSETPPEDAPAPAGTDAAADDEAPSGEASDETASDAEPADAAPESAAPEGEPGATQAPDAASDDTAAPDEEPPPREPADDAKSSTNKSIPEGDLLSGLRSVMEKANNSKRSE
mgnify:FL=1